jgi:catechol 2,3-dioxygenase-like lactoylglutathione lyase family enzyme
LRFRTGTPKIGTIEEAPMVKTEGLYHIHLVVSDIERALNFYRDVFGMQEMFRSGPRMVFLTTPGTRDLITLNQDEAQRDQVGNSGGIAHFGLRITDAARLDDAVQQVKRHGGALVSRGEHAPGAPYAYIRDPDGYVIELS